MAITRTTLTDDSGGGTDGTVFNNAWLQAAFDTLDGRWSESYITSTGTQNNLSISDADVVIFNNASDLTLTGIAAPSSPAKPGKPLRYLCIGAGNVYFAHESGSSTSTNRIRCKATSGNAAHVAGKGSGILVYAKYDGTNYRWNLIQHEQGGAIDYAATSTVTGWSSTTTKIIRYRLSGRWLHLAWNISGTSNATGASFTIPYTSASLGTALFEQIIRASDNGGAYASGLFQAADNSATMNIYKDLAGSAFTNSGTKIVVGQTSVEVA